MQFLLDIEELSDIVNNSFDSTFSDEELYEIRRVCNFKECDAFERVNIGPGADWWVVWGILSIQWSIFKLPGIIKQSLESWEWLLKKLKCFRERNQLVSLDQDAAVMLALDYLANMYGKESEFKIIDVHTIPIVDISGMFPDHRKYSLVCHPHNYYVLTIWIKDKIIILGVRSTGKIRKLESFSDMPYGLLDSE